MLKRLCGGVLCALLWIGTAAAENVLHRGNRFEPASLDPHQYQTQYEGAIILDLFEGLTAFDAAAKLVPGIAESWTASADGKTWTFKLRPELRWSDGAALSADDVVYSFRRLLDPATAAQYAQLMYRVRNGRAVNSGEMPVEKLGVSAPDAFTVVLHLDAPAPFLPEILANPFAAIVPRHALAQHGKDWVKPGAMVSNGAFTLADWQPQNKIELVRNAKFHDAARVKLDRVIYYPTADLNSALAQFRAGSLDMQFEFPTSRVDFLRQEFAAETRIAPSMLTYYVPLNTTNPKFADGRVRRALSMAIDRDVLVSRVTRLGEQPATSFVPPSIANYTPAEMTFLKAPSEARLAEARKLLADAGYGPANPLKFSYSYTSNEDFKRIAVAIAGMWKRVGVETELLNREGKVHFAALKGGDFEAGFVGWSADFNDASTFLYVLQSTTVNSNYGRYRNPVFDELMAQAGEEVDPARRADIMRQAEQLALDDQPIIPLYYGVTKNLVAPRVVGWTANPQDFYLSRYLSLAGSAAE
ncbi:MAG: peptide ABC transporter substrate-binding protein [Rhodospirillaceae bacterium]|nr:peptide ABC transporter substrate-binding protein [Rhodospirillaceae bacterium]